MGFDSVGVAWVERLRLLPPVGLVGAALAGVDLFHRVGCFQAAAATECGLLVRRAVAPGAAAGVRTPLACGGTGLAGIGQLADIAMLAADGLRRA
jgi:hypothetical protein